MRINSSTSYLLAALAVCLFTSVGCDNGTETKTKSDDHGHAHDGEHAHHHEHPPHGPFGGHIFTLDSPEYQCEWKKYSDNDVIRMYILDVPGDAKMKPKAVPMKVDSFMVMAQAGSDGAKFQLEAEKPDENGATAVFMLEDKALATTIPLGVDIEIKVGDKVYKGQIKAHKPLDH